MWVTELGMWRCLNENQCRMSVFAQEVICFLLYFLDLFWFELRPRIFFFFNHYLIDLFEKTAVDFREILPIVSKHIDV